MIIRNDIPTGYTYDEHGNVLTFKESDSFWCEYTYDEHGNVLTFKDSNGYWREYTRDQNGNVLTIKDSNGFWSEYTRDEHGKELTYKDSDGKDGVAIACSDNITLFHNKQNDTFFADCSGVLSREQALARMDREDDRACLFTLAIGLN